MKCVIDDLTQSRRFSFFEKYMKAMISEAFRWFFLSKGETLRDCRSHRIFGVGRRGASPTIAPRRPPRICGKLDNRLLWI